MLSKQHAMCGITIFPVQPATGRGFFKSEIQIEIFSAVACCRPSIAPRSLIPEPRAQGLSEEWRRCDKSLIDSNCGRSESESTWDVDSARQQNKEDERRRDFPGSVVGCSNRFGMHSLSSMRMWYLPQLTRDRKSVV